MATRNFRKIQLGIERLEGRDAPSTLAGGLAAGGHVGEVVHHHRHEHRIEVHHGHGGHHHTGGEMEMENEMHHTGGADT